MSDCEFQDTLFLTDSCGSSDSSEGFFFPSRSTENLKDEDYQITARAVCHTTHLDPSNLSNNKFPTTRTLSMSFSATDSTESTESCMRSGEVHTEGGNRSNTVCKIVSRTCCESTQFYAGNELSTSLVTATPADIYNSGAAELLDTTSAFLEKIVVLNHLSQLQQKQQPKIKVNFQKSSDDCQPHLEKKQLLNTNDTLSPCNSGSFCSDNSITIEKSNTSSSNCFSVFKDHDSGSSASPHVHFASPLMLVNAYTPEYDLSPSTTSTTDRGFNDTMRSLAAEMMPLNLFETSQLFLNPISDITESDLSEIELKEQHEHESAAYLSKILKLVNANTKNIPSDIIRRQLDIILEISQKFSMSILLKKKTHVKNDWLKVMDSTCSLGFYTGIPSSARLSSRSFICSSSGSGANSNTSSLLFYYDEVD